MMRKENHIPGDPVKCTRFTYETFPVPEGYPHPERSVRPVSKRFGELRSEHQEKFEQYREPPPDSFGGDENLQDEIEPAENVVKKILIIQIKSGPCRTLMMH